MVNLIRWKQSYIGDKDKTLNYNPKSDEMVITVHRWFANKSCPGNWLYARLGDLATKVTAQLAGTTTTAPETPTATLYRVRKTWSDSKTQKGAFKVLSNAKKCADDNAGYSVFDEKGKVVYTGKNKLEPTGLECHARTINELDLQEIVLTALNELLGDKSKYQKQLQQNIASVIRASAAITTDGIDEKLMELQQELVKKANNKEAYDEIADQIFALREKRQQASMDTVQRDEQLQRITELQDFIKDQPSDLTVFDEALVKRWLKQIVIWPTHCTVELKSGLKVDVER